MSSDRTPADVIPLLRLTLPLAERGVAVALVAGFHAAREHYGDGVAFRRLGYMTADDTLTAWYGEEVAR